MIRIICRRSDDCCTVHTGAPPLIEHKTFDVELPEVEKWLAPNSKFKYEVKQVIGVELLPPECACSCGRRAVPGEEWCAECRDEFQAEEIT